MIQICQSNGLMQVSIGQKVIDDEEFEAKLAAIIERDYFPDVKRLQNRLEWTEAADSKDPEQMANAQRNIVLRRAGFSVRYPSSGTLRFLMTTAFVVFQGHSRTQPTYLFQLQWHDVLLLLARLLLAIEMSAGGRLDPSLGT